MKYSVDRMEGDYAVLESENGDISQVPASVLPQGTQEGSVVVGSVNDGFVLDEAAERERRERLFRLQNSLFDE